MQIACFLRSTEAFTYDTVGNRLTGPAYPKASTFLQSYAYDFENRIVSATRQVTGNPNADTVTFKYDPFGRRIEKNVSTYESGIPTTYKYTYVYDNEDIILEVLEKTQNNNTTTTTTAYTNGPGIDEPLSLTRDGQTYYYHADGLGSITSMTDSTEAVVNRYTYDSFGALKSSETIRNAYAYTGREYDNETGLYYYRARYYDPEAGRFVSKDPIGFAGGINVYNYLAGDPINFVDPLGLFNPAKGLTSMLNAANAGRLYATGFLKLAAAAGLEITGIGAPAGTGIALLGMWNIHSAGAAKKRALQQWQESFDESWSDASKRNLLGVLPYGQNFDDTCEPTPSQFLQQRYEEIKREPSEMWDFIQEFGTVGL